MVADPTLTFLDRFNDPSQWDQVIENVPIFIEHERRGPDGKALYHVDEKRLCKIADNINDLLSERGVVLRVTNDHTKLIPSPGDPKRKVAAPQVEQPKIVAYAKGAKLGPFGPGGTMAIVSTFYYRKGCGHYAQEYPYRSAEFFPTTDEIRGVALLQTDPALDMGMVCYQVGDGLYLYDRESAMADEMTKEKPEFTDEKKPPTAAADPTKPPNKDAEPPITEGDLSPEEARTAQRMWAHYEKTIPAVKAMCAKYAMTMPSATNGVTPGANPGDKPQDKPDAVPGKRGMGEKPEREDMSKTETPTQYQRQQEARIQRVEAENAKLREDYARERATTLVTQLTRTEGFFIADPKKEIERLTKMTPAECEERVQEIREHYQRDPTAGAPLEIYSGPMPGGGPDPDEFTEADMPAAEQYMRDHPGCDWEPAQKHAIEQRKTRKGKRRAM